MAVTMKTAVFWDVMPHSVAVLQWNHLRSRRQRQYIYPQQWYLLSTKLHHITFQDTTLFPFVITLPASPSFYIIPLYHYVKKLTSYCSVNAQKLVSSNLMYVLSVWFETFYKPYVINNKLKQISDIIWTVHRDIFA